MSAFTLAACAEMLFTDLPMVQRVRRLHDLGFAVEIWDWSTKDLDALRRTGAAFTSMTGYLRGDLVTADGSAQLLATAAESIQAAHRLGCRGLNFHGTGLGEGGLPVVAVQVVTGPMWLAALRTCEALARLGERHDVVFNLENLNTLVDHPGTPFARAADTHALVAAVDHPHLRMNLDLYHAQIGEGNLIELVRACADHLGEVQVADVPGRFEPGTGEIRYPAVAAALAQSGYRGVVGLEAWAHGDPEVALSRFREAFTI